MWWYFLSSRMGILKKKTGKITGAGEYVKKSEPLYIVGKDVKY